ncbi:Conserved_hypothetical protein [Hexamita inflata]|uniref:Uncharacterized protein n=1 Tax=Hexamita inflata TaxID=28002 RepID=A0AA86V0R2_9EUKA|nr:Conserved hypothetical protein [Hexamita inflata]
MNPKQLYICQNNEQYTKLTEFLLSSEFIQDCPQLLKVIHLQPVYYVASIAYIPQKHIPSTLLPLLKIQRQKSISAQELELAIGGEVDHQKLLNMIQFTEKDEELSIKKRDQPNYDQQSIQIVYVFSEKEQDVKDILNQVKQKCKFNFKTICLEKQTYTSIYQEKPDNIDIIATLSQAINKLLNTVKKGRVITKTFISYANFRQLLPQNAVPKLTILNQDLQSMKPLISNKFQDEIKVNQPIVLNSVQQNKIEVAVTNKPMAPQVKAEVKQQYNIVQDKPQIQNQIIDVSSDSDSDDFCNIGQSDTNTIYYPSCLLQVNTQLVNVNQLQNRILQLEQIQNRVELIKSQIHKCFQIFGLPLPLSDQEIKLLGLNDSDIIFNRPMKFHELQQYVTIDFSFSSAQYNQAATLKKSLWWIAPNTVIPLACVFQTLLSDEQLRLIIIRYTQQFVITRFNKWVGITVYGKRSVKFWQLIQKQVSNYFCSNKIMKQFCEFEVFQKLSTNSIKLVYHKEDLKWELDELQQDLIMRINLEIYLKRCKHIENVIFIDFEFYTVTSSFIVPFEIGIVRVHNGKIAAKFQAFVEPNSDLLDSLSDNQWRRVQKFYCAPRSPVSKRLNPVEMNDLAKMVKTFMFQSSQQIKARLGKYQSYFEILEQFDVSPPLVVANGIQAERLALEQLQQQFLCENIVEFNDLMECFGKNQPVTHDQMHGPDMQRHRCDKHLLSNHHCAINDAMNLAEIFVQSVNEQNK